MALVQCVECGNDVSDKAAACPHCGYPSLGVARAGTTSPERIDGVPGRVIVRGYYSMVPDSPKVGVVWNNIEKGQVGKAGIIRFAVEKDGELTFSSGTHRAAVPVSAGLTNEIQLSFDGATGELNATLVQQSFVDSPPKPGTAPSPPQAGTLKCPHCGSHGTVERTTVKVKKGYSLGKIATGFFSMGQSVLFTGVSRTGVANQLSCSACGTVWHVE